MKEEKEKLVPYSFRVPESLLVDVHKKIDKENAKAKIRKNRITLSSKMKELLYDYISR